MRQNGDIEYSDEQIEEIAEDHAATYTAQFISHNPASQGAQSFFSWVMTQSDHPNGPAWSNSLNKNMRMHDSSRQ